MRSSKSSAELRSTEKQKRKKREGLVRRGISLPE